ncbi:polysaccharide biosynthesis C-terminal domain-containing protein [Marivita sp.]|uniref:lipopolysaccharide biosynthesis protein n=1 Tax=Marivita sp. TaxID=2003365 RepID=UPI0025BD76CD|nr:polysaccharide biosynthesis C-terminal domain-containing protein [Marivita sp.]
MKKLLLGSVLSAGIKIASAGLTFLMFLFLARALGAEEYGKFGTMFSLGTFGGVLALCGQHTMSIKVLSSLEEKPGQGATRRRFVLRSYAIIAVVTVLCVGGFFLTYFSANRFGMGFSLPIIVGASAFILPFALSDLVANQVRAFGAISAALVPRDIVWRACIILLCLAALSWPGVMPDALSAMVTISGILMLIIFLQMGYFFSRNRRMFAGPRTAQTESPKQISIWMWIASLALMGASLNIVVASPFLSNDQIGAYFAAHKTSQLLLLPVMAINVVAAPTFARFHSQGKNANLQDVGRKLAIILAPPLFGGALFLVILAPNLLALFDPAYASAAPALVVLAMSFLFFGLGGPTPQLMLMAGGERDYVKMTLVSDGIGLCLLPFLIPAFGIVGAAMGLLVSRILFTIMAVTWCRTNLRVDTSILSLLPRAALQR